MKKMTMKSIVVIIQFLHEDFVGDDEGFSSALLKAPGCLWDVRLRSENIPAAEL